jgi:glycerophosphoryl diester phosphodiesterase
MAVERFGTDMLELDVHLSRDGEVVVAHDATLERCTDGAGPLAALTLDALQRLDAGFRFTPDGRSFPFRGQGVRIPTLREVLRTFPGLRINIDLKTEASGAEQALAEVVRAEEALARVCVGGETDPAAERLLGVLPDACHFYPTNALAAFVMAVRSGAEPPREERFHVLDVPLHFGGVRLVDGPLLAQAARAGKWVNVWTVDDAQEMRRLVRERVGGIMTDRPDLLRAVLDERA